MIAEPPFFFSLKHMLTKPSYYSLSPSPERRGSPLGYHPTLGHQVTAGLNSPSPNVAQPGSPARGKGYNVMEQRQSPSPIVMEPT